MVFGAIILFVFVVSLAIDQYEAHFGDEGPGTLAPAPRRQNAPVVTAGEMTLSGSASVDDIRGGLNAATGGVVTITSFTQRVSSDATLPISVSEFDETAEVQFVTGVSAAVSVPESSIVDVNAEAVSAGRRRRLQSTATKISYVVAGEQGSHMHSIVAWLRCILA